jgi:hypothetical protein
MVKMRLLTRKNGAAIVSPLLPAGRQFPPATAVRSANYISGVFFLGDHDCNFIGGTYTVEIKSSEPPASVISTVTV